MDGQLHYRSERIIKLHLIYKYTFSATDRHVNFFAQSVIQFSRTVFATQCMSLRTGHKATSNCPINLHFPTEYSISHKRANCSTILPSLSIHPSWATLTEVKMSENSIKSSIRFPSDCRRWSVSKIRLLIVYWVFMIAFATLIKYCGPFINTSQLHRIEIHFMMSTFWTWFFNRCMFSQFFLYLILYNPRWLRCGSTFRHDFFNV